MSGAVAEAPGKTFTPRPLRMSRNVLGCWYVVVDWYPPLDVGLIAAQYTRPPPSVLSPPDSSNTRINRPSGWTTGLPISGATLVCSQPSAVPKEQSRASLPRLGTLFED